MPLPPPPERGLDEQREPDALCLLDEGGDVGRLIHRRGLERPGDDRDSGRRCIPTRGQLVTELRNRRTAWADERQACILDSPGEFRALGQEAVPGMDRLRPALRGSVENRFDPQVTLRSRSRPNADRIVGCADVRGPGVGVTEDCNGFDPQLVARPDDPDGDLAAVRDEDATERWRPAASVFAQRRRGCRGHSGMFPCFFGGLVSRLSASSSRALMSRGRVSDGTMTSST